jgi:two-component system sensor histidine kinase PhoQ
MLSIAVTWELAEGELKPYTFYVAASLDSFNAQIAAYRRQLFSWFAAIAVIMLFAISLVMGSVLRPLRQIEEEIHDIEGGQRAALSDYFPTELRGVARNLNLLIGSERGRAERYRQTLDNLAHSLKTPLAAMRAILEEQAGTHGERLDAQIERMNDIVRYQLRKPATNVADTLGIAPLDLTLELQRLADGLKKVYRDKEPRINITVAAGAEFRGDRGDFLELAGNLLDNACKWCRSQVDVDIDATIDSAGRKGITLKVMDDGDGIPQESADRLLERGMRLDESAPGHGIGLAVVKDIAVSYSGDVKIGAGPPGGAPRAGPRGGGRPGC